MIVAERKPMIIWSSRLRRWLCLSPGRYVVGTGRTVRDAYADWCEHNERVKMLNSIRSQMGLKGAP